MNIEYSKHWLRKHVKKRKDITNDAIEFAIRNSKETSDKYWKDAFNAISKVPPSGRTLKAVYKKQKEKIFIITAYWLD
ncbi:hypothetical protein HY212_05215 [Candidatus Pacearchaeota archaeon]|nr:hypothetical protein [Candidatus Pacearchaeota archaeon]